MAEGDLLEVIKMLSAHILNPSKDPFSEPLVKAANINTIAASMDYITHL